MRRTTMRFQDWLILGDSLSKINVGLAWWYWQIAKDQLPEDKQR